MTLGEEIASKRDGWELLNLVSLAGWSISVTGEDGRTRILATRLGNHTIDVQGEPGETVENGLGLRVFLETMKQR